ncbi:MAG: kinase-like domain-containing protein [Monoraphidium minutum]|nr:MAG: kinase-like domain-containing protein [Monoraphidium minutum]
MLSDRTGPPQHLIQELVGAVSSEGLPAASKLALLEARLTGRPGSGSLGGPGDAALPRDAPAGALQQPSKRRKTSKPLHRQLDSGSNGAFGGGGASGLGAGGGGGGGGTSTSGSGSRAGQREPVIVIDGGSNPPSPFNQGSKQQQAALPPSRTPRSASKQPLKGQTPINRFFLPAGNSHDSHSRDSEPASTGAPRPQQHPAAGPPRSIGAAVVAAAAAGGGGDAGLAPVPEESPRGHPPQPDGGADERARRQPQPRQRGEQEAEAARLRERLRQQELEAGELLRQQEAFRRREAKLAAQLQEARGSGSEAAAQLEALQAELARARGDASERDTTARAAIASLARGLATKEGALARLQLAAGAARLGTLSVARSGPMGFAEVWEDGQAFLELSRQAAALQRQKEEIEAARKALKRRLPPPPRGAGAGAAAGAAADSQEGSGGGSGGGGGEAYLAPAEYVSRDEILKVRLAALKREEEALSREEERLALDRIRHIRLLKRVRDEEGSRFSGHQPLLHGRYVLMGLLGKGGFSEVHKAFDLSGLATVAVKVHQLNSAWAEAKKASYVRHAVREYSIHKALRHPNIVGLLDIFEVDANTFATVLELCPGGDLDTHLKEHTTLPEREARAVMAQVFAGLAYLNRGGGGEGGGGGGGPLPRVIHYDLKPANILFDELGGVKITDFGLSKVGMELTSQGAGTYWYLPPECFEVGGGHHAAPGPLGAAAGSGLAAAIAGGGALSGGGTPRISNKVDVWSAGVIFYQMLYGRRPFGEGLSQEQIFRERVVLNARQVEFPAKPAVSAEARAFISRCLAYRQHDRWDVLTAAADPYLQLKR